MSYSLPNNVCVEATLGNFWECILRSAICSSKPSAVVCTVLWRLVGFGEGPTRHSLRSSIVAWHLRGGRSLVQGECK